MLSSAIALIGIMVAVLVAVPCSGEELIGVPGGWQRKNVGDEAIYEELAHFAISKQVDNREFFDTVLELLEVQTQVVAGINYRIKFKTAESTCRITEAYSKELCQPKTPQVVEDTIAMLVSTAVKDVCTAEVVDGVGNVRTLLSFTCQGSS